MVKKLSALLLCVALLLTLLAGCGQKKQDVPQALLVAGSHAYLYDRIWISYSKSYHTEIKSNVHTVVIHVPEDMPMDCFFASLTVTHLDGTQEDLLENAPLEAGGYFILEDLELNYEAVELSMWFSWNGQELDGRFEDLLNPTEGLREATGYTP